MSVAPLLQKNGTAFYEDPNYLETAKASLSTQGHVPVGYTINIQYRILRFVKSIVLAPYHFMHALVGTYVFRAYKTKFQFNEFRPDVDYTGPLKFFRTTLKVDDYSTDLLIMGNPSMLTGKRVIFHLQDDSDLYERRSSSSVRDITHLAWDLNATLVMVNLSGTGVNFGYPSLDRNKKICQAVFEMIQDKNNGLNANEVILSGHGMGAAIQQASLEDFKFHEDVTKVSFLNKSFTSISDMMSHRVKNWAVHKWEKRGLSYDSYTVRLIGFLAAQIIWLSGWEIDNVELGKKQNHSIIIYNNGVEYPRKSRVYYPMPDGEIPAELALFQKVAKPSQVLNVIDPAGNSHHASLEYIDYFKNEINKRLAEA